MRVNCSDEEEYPGQFGLYQANCRRSLRGRKGRAALLELETALVSMPEKRIQKDVLVAADGEVCAIGSLMVHKKISTGMSREQAVLECSHVDPSDTENQGVLLGMPRLVAWSVAVENDEYDEWDQDDEGMGTEQQRYERMLRWVRKELAA